MGYSNWDDDKADIDAVIAHFERQGYYIYALIGHSRGKANPFVLLHKSTLFLHEL